MADGQVQVEWGDGTSETVAVGAPLRHAYPEPGTYQLTVRKLDGTLVTRDTVVIRGREPQVVLFASGDDPWQALLWVDEPDDGATYRVDWGDGSPVESVPGQRRVPPHPRAPHQYAAADTYDIAVTDMASRRTAVREFTAGHMGVLFTWDSPHRITMDSLWLRTDAQWEVDGATGHHSGQVPAAGRVTRRAQSDIGSGTYDFRLRELVDGQARRELKRRYEVPTSWDWRMDVALSWTRADADGFQAVTVTPKGARTPCTVEWGDGSPHETVEPGGMVTHQYAVPPPAPFLLRVTETTTDAVSDPRTFTRAVAAPRAVATPVLNARHAGAIDWYIEGADDDMNSDWYTVDWGDGQRDEMGAVGRAFPAHHTYTAERAFRVRVDGPGMPQPVERQAVCRMYPAPTVSVVEKRESADDAPREALRLTVQVTVDNRGPGGPCTVDMGDGSAPVECAETDSFVYTYADPAPEETDLELKRTVRWLVATSDDDPTAKARASVTIPFGQGRTLLYEVRRPAGGGDLDAQLTVTSALAGRDVQVQWGDGDVDIVPPSGVVLHTFADEGQYFGSVGYTDGSESYYQIITVPLEEE